MMGVVRGFRMILTVLYASYLVNVGLLLLFLPWSAAWPRFVLLIPPQLAVFLDHPAVRGAVSAFGVLHLILLLTELINPTRLVEPRSNNHR
jgi:hypothetical protein